MKNLATLLEEFNVEIKPIGKNIYRGFCPFPGHNDVAGGKPQFTYYSESDSYFCFRCGEGGDAVRFLATMNGISYADAKKKLIGTEQEQLEELKNNLENLDIEISSLYNLQLNFALRPKFRDLFYKYPDRSQDILMGLKALDAELTKEINFNKMQELFERFKRFQEQVVAESGRV
jgi:DNA primase